MPLGIGTTMNQFEVGDEVVLSTSIGRVVGFNSRDWPIVEWPSIDEVLVENPSDIELLTPAPPRKPFWDDGR